MAKAKRAQKSKPVIRKKSKAAADQKSVAGRAGSKKEMVLGLLCAPEGATITDIMKATGWQPHSVRGFLSGTVGKKMKLTVVSTSDEGGERNCAIKA
jgi:uncharacterized protein DUF3489